MTPSDALKLASAGDQIELVCALERATIDQLAAVYASLEGQPETDASVLVLHHLYRELGARRRAAC